MKMAEPLCKQCDNKSQGPIIVMKESRIILNPEPIKILFCPNCYNEYTEHQVIWSNMTWLYKEDDIRDGHI